MAAGGGGHRAEVADALIAGAETAGRSRSCATWAGSGPATSRCSGPLGPGRSRRAAWRSRPATRWRLMSSNAATFASAALAWHDVAELLDAGLGIAALTFCALEGNQEAFAAAVTDARPLAGLVAVSGRLRTLTAGAPPAARIQDPFGLRCLPPVAGALDWAVRNLHDVLAVEINAAAENPLVAGEEVLHHGGFHDATCALRSTGCGWRSSRSRASPRRASRVLMAPGLDRPARVPLRRGAGQLRRADHGVPGGRRARPAARRRRTRGARTVADLRAGWSTPASPGRPPARRATRSSTCARARARVARGRAGAAHEGDRRRRAAAPVRGRSRPAGTRRSRTGPLGDDAERAVAALPALAAVVRPGCWRGARRGRRSADAVSRATRSVRGVVPRCGTPPMPPRPARGRIGGYPRSLGAEPVLAQEVRRHRLRVVLVDLDALDELLEVVRRQLRADGVERSR